MRESFPSDCGRYHDHHASHNFLSSPARHQYVGQDPAVHPHHTCQRRLTRVEGRERDVRNAVHACDYRE